MSHSDRAELMKYLRDYITVDMATIAAESGVSLTIIYQHMRGLKTNPLVMKTIFNSLQPDWAVNLPEKFKDICHAVI